MLEDWLEHWPGLGLGTERLGRGSKLELDEDWLLKLPSKLWVRSDRVNLQIALPGIELLGVVKTA